MNGSWSGATKPRLQFVDKRMREAVERITSPDGQLRITLYRRSDARYEYSVDKFYVDDLPEYDHHMEYWSTLHFSGIYDSAETAICDASIEFRWVGGGDPG